MGNVAWIYILHLIGIILVTEGQDYEYLNCYYDIYNARILKDLTDCSDATLCDCSKDAPFCEHNLMTIGFCENLCRRKNFKYFGLQAGNQCFCGGGFSYTGEWHLADTTSALQRCQTQCAGDSSQECGGDYLMRVFRFKDPLSNSACFHPGSPGDTSVNQQVLQDYFFDVGETIQYECVQRNFKIIGVSEIECHSTGQWTSSPPSSCQCCAAQCPPPPIPHNAFQSSGSTNPDGVYYERDTVTFVCSTDFSLFTVSCTYTGTWTDPGNPCPDLTTKLTTTTQSTTTQPTTSQPTTTQPTTTAKEPTTKRLTTLPPRPPPATPFRCPSISCGFYCPYGFQQDSLGCYICQCISPPTTAVVATTTPRRGCIPITCNKSCPYGLQVDVYGCTACECVRPPAGVQTTPISTQKKDTTSATTVISEDSNSTKKHLRTLPPTKNTNTPSHVADSSRLIDALPFIVGGVALMVIILVIVLIVNCTQRKRQSKKPKGPAPPPPDYPTLDRNHHENSKDELYDCINEPKRKKRNNSYVQNDIPNAPSPPTVSQNVSQKQFANTHSLNRSLIGGKHSPHSHSLNRSIDGGGHNSQSLSRSVNGGAHSPHSLSLNRSMAGGYHTPNSQSLSRSMGSVSNSPNSHSLSRSIGGNSHVSSSHAQYSNSLSRSVASGSDSLNRSLAGSAQYANSLSRSVSSDPLTARNHHIPMASGQNTPRALHRSIANGSYTPTSRQRSMAGGLHTPNSQHRPIANGPQTPISQHRSIANESQRSSSQSLNRSMATGFHTPLNSRHRNDHSPFTRTQSMYSNLPPTPTADQVISHGSLDRININSAPQGNQMYMNTIKQKTAERPRPPQRAPSTEILSGPGRRQENLRKSSTGSLPGRGPGLRINTQMKPSGSLERRTDPPDSPFGDSNLEMTTRL